MLIKSIVSLQDNKSIASLLVVQILLESEGVLFHVLAQLLHRLDIVAKLDLVFHLKIWLLLRLQVLEGTECSQIRSGYNP